jgi:putative ABC transport system permease protein
MLTVTLAGIWARKRRLLGTCTAVVLGVAFLAATLVLADSMRAGFNRAFTEANAGTDIVVRSSTVIGSDETKVRDTIPTGVLDTVAALDGVAVAVPSIEGTATIIGADGDRIGGDGPPTTGANWIDDPDLNPYRLAEGRAPAADDEVVIDRGSAERGDLAVGDRTTVLTPDPVDVTIAGIATFGDVDSLGPTTYTAFTLDAARDLLLDRPDALSSVLVAAEDGVNPTTLRDEIAQLVPARIEALTQQELTAEQEADIESDFLGMFEVFLLAFAGIALVVAAFSIHNTFSILVAQRTRESALLRAMGASRRQVLLAVAMEAVVVGVVASAVGLGVGLGLATGLDAILAGSGLDLPGGLVVGADALVIAAAVGIVTTLLASLAPAVSASKVAPLAALRDVAVDRSAASRVRAVTGMVITVAGVVAVATATIIGSDGAVSRAALGALAVVVGAVVLGPVVARPAAGLLGGVAPTFSGRLARRNAMRNPRRIAGSASALMVGTAVVALFTTFGSSIKASFDEIVDDQFAGDLIVQQDGFSGAGLPPELAAAIEASPAVTSATGLSLVTASVDGSTADATAADPAALTEMLDVGVTAGSVRNVAAGQVAISEQYAESHDLALGDSIPMTFVDGATVDLSVAAVYAERTTVEDLLITSEDWAAHARGRGDVVVFIDLAPGVDEATGAAAVDAVTAQLSAPESMTRDEYLDFVGNEVDQMLTFVYGMLGIAVLIALLGIGNTLSLSIHERRRELGLLRAVGQSRAQLRATVRWESVIVAVFGTLGGLAVGTFLGWGLVRAVNAQEGFGVFDAPVGALGVVLVLAAAAGVLAALRPARRAARLDALQAIAAE